MVLDSRHVDDGLAQVNSSSYSGHCEDLTIRRWCAVGGDTSLPSGGTQCYSAYDNFQPETSRISQRAMQDEQMLPCPSFSPDPIEHVTSLLIW
ncbi:hypothetical protein NPIL_499131 [Nephila pilipes]|uniref:Uncharacterized protein n=1 Tax=Nephila pilipes TaxID=299642 RepID=A0A8X6T9U7_NEPPI|nr:hypothetical protein NPIL_499131 [Nephila pilipes]